MSMSTQDLTLLSPDLLSFPSCSSMGCMSVTQDVQTGSSKRETRCSAANRFNDGAVNGSDALQGRNGESRSSVAATSVGQEIRRGLRVVNGDGGGSLCLSEQEMLLRKQEQACSSIWTHSLTNTAYSH